jgi:hypothetical protein
LSGSCSIMSHTSSICAFALSHFSCEVSMDTPLSVVLITPPAHAPGLHELDSQKVELTGSLPSCQPSISSTRTHWSQVINEYEQICSHCPSSYLLLPGEFITISSHRNTLVGSGIRS